MTAMTLMTVLYGLRGRANRLWSAGGSALPTVANPALSDEPPNYYDYVRERDPEVYDPILPLGTHTNFLWALCQEFVLSTTQRKPTASGAGTPFLATMPTNPRLSR